MLPQYRDVLAAAGRLRAVVHRTPLVRSRQLDHRCGMSIRMKAENLQRAGSFKIRGAYNLIAQLPDDARRRGVLAYSSGNHAQGVALAAALLGVPATIVVPHTIASSKRAAAAGYGARLIECGSTSAERQEHALERARTSGETLVPPYDHPHILAGQGTVGLEILEDEPDVATVVVPVGGGGLLAGCCIALRQRLGARVRIVGVEPEDAHDTFLSLQRGQRVRISPPRTVADGLRAVEPGELTFEINRRMVDEIVLVRDDEIRAAMAFVLERAKLLVEPSGAVGVAACLAGKVPRGSRDPVVVVLSGGNVPLAALAELPPA